jgi:hypothetical protein
MIASLKLIMRRLARGNATMPIQSQTLMET